MRTRRTLVVVAAATTITVVIPAAAAVAEGVDAGDVVLVDPANPAMPVNQGDSFTPFAFKLPDDARCGGDSMHDGWVVNTFLVPDSADLDNLEFDGTRPLGGEDFLPMRDITGNLLIGELTGANDGPGQQAVIPQLPPMSFENWDPALFKTGTYAIGVACNKIGDPVERYWDARVVLVEDPSVERWERRWELVEEFRGEPETDNSRRNLLLAVAGLASLVFVAVTWYGRRRSSLPPPTESPVTAGADEPVDTPLDQGASS